jgi:hypothetical protein
MTDSLIVEKYVLRDWILVLCNTHPNPNKRLSGQTSKRFSFILSHSCETFSLMCHIYLKSWCWIYFLIDTNRKIHRIDAICKLLAPIVFSVICYFLSIVHTCVIISLFFVFALVPCTKLLFYWFLSKTSY